MNIIITAKMGNGTIQAKLEPLSRVEKIQNIYFLRKKSGPIIPKVKYITLPSVCRFSLFNLVLTPLLLAHHVIRNNCSFIISYHIIPYAFFASFVSLISQRPYFVCQTGLTIQSLANNKLFWPFLKIALINAKKMCVPGSKSLEFWRSKGMLPDKVIKLHSTIDTEYFFFNRTKKMKYDFVYIGRISKEKRVDFIIKAFSMVIAQRPDSKLLVVGDGPLLDQMITYARSLRIKDSIYFAGFQEYVMPWLHQSELILLSSETEGLPCAIMEGMSVGLIPITTDVGNLSDIVIPGETGFLVNKDDINGFAKSMLNAIELNNLEKAVLSNNARSLIVSHHSHHVSQMAWEALL